MTTATAQRSQALDRANEVRRHRHRLKQELRSLPHADARALMADVLENLPWWLEAQGAYKALCWVPWLTARQVEPWLVACGVRAAQKVLGALTERQRTVLAGLLRTGRLS